MKNKDRLEAVGLSTPARMREVAAWIREGRATGKVREPDPDDIEEWAAELEALQGEATS